jgi:hypothetical protein
VAGDVGGGGVALGELRLVAVEDGALVPARHGCGGCGGSGGGGGERETRAWLRYGKSGKTAMGVEDWREEGNREDLAGKRWVFWRDEAVAVWSQLPLV